MPRARSHSYDHRQTAVAQEDAGGCLSFYILPPFAVILIACLLTTLTLHAHSQISAMPIVQSQPLSPSTPASSSGLSPIFTREVQYWGNDILRWANASSLDPNLAATVMLIESCGDPQALSRSVAMGLFQVMPFHFYFGENGFDPETNARRGLDYLARSLQTAGGDPRLALAGYNGGIGLILSYFSMATSVVGLAAVLLPGFNQLARRRAPFWLPPLPCTYPNGIKERVGERGQFHEQLFRR